MATKKKKKNNKTKTGFNLKDYLRNWMPNDRRV